MENLTTEQVVEQLNSNADLLTAVLDHVVATEQGQTIVNTRAEQLYKDKIGTEVSTWYKGIDDDVFGIIGERPRALEDGKMQKTRDFLKEKITRLKELEGMADSLNADTKVQELQAQLTQLQAEGAGSHWKKTYDTDKVAWEQKQTELQTQLTEANNKLLDYQKQQDIDKGLVGLKFNDKIPKNAINALLGSVMTELKGNSRIEDGKVIYLGADGQRLNNPNFTPMSAGDILKTRLKDVLFNEDTSGGGGAPQTIGAIVTTPNADGNDVKTLNLDESKIVSKSAFVQESERVLAEAGITRGNPLYDKLTTEAYSRYKVKDLPR